MVALESIGDVLGWYWDLLGVLEVYRIYFGMVFGVCKRDVRGHVR